MTMEEKAEELRAKFFKEHTRKDENGITRVTTHPHNLFEWFKTPQGEKEEVESGWVIVDPEGEILTGTFYRVSFGSCTMSYSGTLRAWKKKVEKGYKCVRAERVTRLTDTTKRE